MTNVMHAGIEAGGTKFVCAVGAGPGNLAAVERFPTTTPDETFGRAIDFFRSQNVDLKSLGIASFGPLDPHRDSPTYGYITTTPKLKWHMTDFAGRMEREMGIPVVFDTDVNGAALAEWKWGSGKGLRSVLYLTVGTGIGGGAVVNGQRLLGLLHPEMGHLRIPRKPGDPFSGNCPYHDDCLEGMATGPALEARVGAPAYTLPPDHEAWEYEAYYLAMACTNYILTLSPERIIMGGGVMDQAHLFTKIRRYVLASLNNYIQSPAILDHIDAYIVPPALGNEAGVLGAIALAQSA